MTDGMASQTKLIFLAVGILCLLGLTYLMNKKPANSQKTGTIQGFPPLGPIGRIFLWAKRVLLLGMVVGMALGVILNRNVYLTAAAIALILYVIANRISIIFRATGK
jgi:hypothetical protein